jgi:proteasome accessory factor A
MFVPIIIGTENEYDTTVRFSSESLGPKEMNEFLERAKKEFSLGLLFESKLRMLYENLTRNPDKENHFMIETLTDVFLKAILKNKLICRPHKGSNYDAWLFNGARFYIDHYHPEYCTPECTGVRELLAHNLAGDRIVEEARRNIARLFGANVILMKNNSDGKGTSFGAHENFLLSPELYSSIVYNATTSDSAGLWSLFLISRQIIAGAGKVGCEKERGEASRFEIGARSDFIERISAMNTMENRPIINTRDEAHAQDDKFRRLHVIIGDANMSQWSNYLKFGSAILVIKMLEHKFIKEKVFADNAVEATHAISRDLTTKEKVIKIRGGKNVSALTTQKFFCERAKKFLEIYDGPRKEEFADVVDKWTFVLDKFENNQHKELSSYLDWVFKYRLFDNELVKKKCIDWGSQKMKMADLQYHYLNPEKSLFMRYKNHPDYKVCDILSESEIGSAIETPPVSRALLRALFLRKVGEKLSKMDWSFVAADTGKFDNGRGLVLEFGYQMNDPTFPADDSEVKDAEKITDGVKAATKDNSSKKK